MGRASMMRVSNAKRVVSLRHVARRTVEFESDLESVIDGLAQDVGTRMNKSEASEVIGVSVTTLDKWIDKGLLEVFRAPSARPQLDSRVVIDLAARVDELRRQGHEHHLISRVLQESLTGDKTYQREFQEIYGPGLAAMKSGDFVSAKPGPDFGPED